MLQMSTKMKQIFLITLLVFNIIYPLVSKAEPLYAAGSISGIVKDIDGEGRIVLENNNYIVLWGLKIEDENFLKRLLIDQFVGCLIVGDLGGYYLSDCTLYPQQMNTPVELYKMSLFIWLQELKVATAFCSEREVRFNRTIHDQGPSYSCSHGIPPVRASYTLDQ